MRSAGASMKQGKKRNLLPMFFVFLVIVLQLHFHLVSEIFYSRRNSVAEPDPGSGAFLPPGSGMNFYRIPNLGSRIQGVCFLVRFS
jgi:hypothetical protein